MAKTLRNTKIAKQNRIRVNFHREWNKILIKDSIRNMSQASSLVKQCPKLSLSQNQTHDDIKSGSRERLRRWALEYNISKRAVTALLKILFNFGLMWLPKDSRSLFQTQRRVELSTLNNGKLWYNGVRSNLEMIFANLNSNLKISLCINMDGLPLFNSSKYQFWPILARVFEFPSIRPFVVAIWCGEGKPDCNEFLRQFVDEMKLLIRQGGFMINSYVLKTKVKAIINDTPARAYIKGCKYHNAAEGCQKCTTIGEHSTQKSRMSFPHIDAQKRTNDSFRSRANPGHHREYSIIEELPINMVADFVTSDSLHLFHLGIMKRLLLIWMGEKDNFEFKWNQNDIRNTNTLLANCNADMPFDIHRSVRNSNCIKFWKGTEFRCFLHYIGIVVLKQTLREEEYNHFLKLHCAVTLCSHDNYLRHLDLAQVCFDEYIEDNIDLYGIESIGSNVHNLTHVVDDVRRFGNLTKIDTYPFENALFGLKLKLRTCNSPLEQISRRILELNLDYREPLDLNDIQRDESNDHELKYLIENSGSTDFRYSQISLGSHSFLSSRKFGDKWFLTNDDKIVEFHFATKHNDNYFLNGSRIKKPENFFTQTFSSKFINTYVAKDEKYPAHYYAIEKVKAKLVCLHYEDKLVFTPLLHTLI